MKPLENMNSDAHSLSASKNVTPIKSQYQSPKSKESRKSEFTFNKKHKKDENSANSIQSSSVKANDISNSIYI